MGNNMMGTFEVVSEKNGKKQIRYYTLRIYDGVTIDLYENMVRMGHININIRLI